MQVYLVGGAVRDELLGRPVRERDWVVVGATREQMIDAGYRPVGKGFPVFLHPQTHEEYALARTERKTAPGYRGFEVQAGEGITLEQDLLRRDLTINAMARDAAGTLIDPRGGARDLEARVLRHCSDAFVEDPVRILRVARFSARLPDFGVAPETAGLMARMVERGEVDALVPERVWAELVKALGEPAPGRFVEVLRGCGALARVLPDVDRLFGVPQPPRHHPEVDCGRHLLLCLEQAVRLRADVPARFAVLVHDLGKGTTPREVWPHHHGHERRGAELTRELCERLHAPAAYRDLGMLVARHHMHAHRALELRPAKVHDTLVALDAWRKPGRLERFLVACEADARGRTGLEDRPYPQAARLRAAHAAAAAISGRDLAARGLTGAALGRALREARIQAIRELPPLAG